MPQHPQFLGDHHYHDVIRNYRPGPRDYYPYEYDSCSCSSGSDTGRQGLRGPWCVCLVVCVVVATITAGLGLPLALGPHDLGQLSAEDRLELVSKNLIKIEYWLSWLDMQVRKLLKDVPLVDGHNDLPWNLRKFEHNQLNQLNLSRIRSDYPWSSSKWSHTDLPKYLYYAQI